MTPDIERAIINAYRYKYGRPKVAAQFGTTPDVVRGIWEQARSRGRLPDRGSMNPRVRPVEPEPVVEAVDDMMRGGVRIVKRGDVSLPYLSCLEGRV